MKLIEIENLTVQLGGHTALRDVNLTINAGEIVTIVGPNGSGKSTLLRTIIGALSQSKGRVHLRQGLRIGYVPQRLHIDPTLPLTVRRFLCLPRKVTSLEIEDASHKSQCARAREPADDPPVWWAVPTRASGPRLT